LANGKSDHISGIPGRIYDLSILNPDQVTSLDGAELVRHGAEITGLRIRLPGTDSSSYNTGKIVFHFSAVSMRSRERKVSVKQN
jgi:hypothetical protein